MSAPTTAEETLRAHAAADAETIAAWCSRADAGYNSGAWQTALVLGSEAFRRQVALNLAAMGLPEDHPAMRQWSRELGKHFLVEGSACSCGEWEPVLGESIHRGFDKHLLESRYREAGL